MVQWMLFKWRLAKVQRERAKTVKEHREARAKALADPRGEQLMNGLHQDQYLELTMIDSTRAYLVTSRLVSIAHGLMLPPMRGECWEKCVVTGYRILTDEGIHELRSAIREEKKARREAALSWLAAATGVIGALTGLAAVVFGVLF